MTFLTTELSSLLGSPYELYEFATGTASWRYTSGRKKRTTAKGDWEPRALSRSKIEQSRSFSRASINVTAPRDLPFALQYISSPPEGLVRLTIYRSHDADPDAEVSTYWTGRVTGVAFSSSGSTATIKCDTAYTGMQALGRRATGSLQCRRTLYATGCNVDRDTFKLIGAIAAVNGLQITSPVFATKPDGWLSGGTLIATVGGKRMGRLIVSHVGANVGLLGPMYGAAVNDTLEAFAGCARDLTTCHDKFNNTENFGGFPWKPLKNPFSGDSVF